MILRQFLHTDPVAISYLFGCGGKTSGAVVDPVGDPKFYIEAAEKASMRILFVIDTHIHADHTSTGRALADLAGAEYALFRGAQASIPFRGLQDGEVLGLGNVTIEVLHTPGHTLDSICLLVSDARRGPEPWFVITGDTLFVGATGRPDLAGREQEMAGMLFDSLGTKLLNLSVDLEIFPGHQAGSACGVGLSGKPSSTIGFEKRWNPLLTMHRDAFVRELTTNIPARPANMDQIVASNIAA